VEEGEGEGNEACGWSCEHRVKYTCILLYLEDDTNSHTKSISLPYITVGRRGGCVRWRTHTDFLDAPRPWRRPIMAPGAEIPLDQIARLLPDLVFGPRNTPRRVSDRHKIRMTD